MFMPAQEKETLIPNPTTTNMPSTPTPKQKTDD
jgi:hypothetical protein